MKWLKYIAIRTPIYALIIYFSLTLVLYSIQDKLLFPRESGVQFDNCPAMLALGAEPKEQDGIRYYEKFDPQNETSLIFFHGNGGVACYKTGFIEHLKDLHLNFYFLEYPGYAGASEIPTQKEILADAEKIYQIAAENSERIFIFGESLGTGPATFVGSREKIAGVILESPYTSIADVAQAQYPFIPARLLIKNPFPAYEWAKQVSAPVLVLRAGLDTTIAPHIIDQEIRNFSPAPVVVKFPNSDHNSMSLLYPKLFWDSIHHFIQRIS